MSKIKRTCKHCSKEFETEEKYTKRGHGKYCSLSCAGKDRPPKKPNVSCAYCDKKFYKSKSKINQSKSGLFFCCREHKDLAQRIGGIKEIQPDHYGTSGGRNGYRKLAFKYYPHKCNRCGYDKFSQALQVHHIDEDRNNNELSNLEILCPTCHWEIHLGLVD